MFANYSYMDVKHIKTFFIKVLLLQLVAISFAFAADSQFTFRNGSTVNLRDADLKNPLVIESGSVITIDPQYLLTNIGTATPTQEQVQRLLLNPGEASNGKIETQQFFNPNSRRPRHDYFFPVTVKTKDGQVKSGNMALDSYNRMGVVRLQRADGQDPTRFQSARTTEQLNTLIDQNREQTEADNCRECAASSRDSTVRLVDSIREVTSNPALNQNDLWNRYQTFAKNFVATNGTSTRATAAVKKRLFVKSLVDTFGAKDAGLIMAALTSFTEAPHRNSNATLMAEEAAVLKVLQNRANANYRTNSRTLRDIGISTSADPLLTAVLADWQFSTWNDRDHNLSKILNFNPDASDAMTKRKMLLAFDAQRKIADGTITFVGRMNDSRLMHYHANYVNPNWDRASARVTAPVVRVDGVNIDLSKQVGSRHIFYAGIS